MFDIIWTDHTRELVGEHRARKELKKAEEEEAKRRRSNSEPSHEAPSFEGEGTVRQKGTPSELKSRNDLMPSSDLWRSGGPDESTNRSNVRAHAEQPWDHGYGSLGQSSQGTSHGSPSQPSPVPASDSPGPSPRAGSVFARRAHRLVHKPSMLFRKNPSPDTSRKSQPAAQASGSSGLATHGSSYTGGSLSSNAPGHGYSPLGTSVARDSSPPEQSMALVRSRKMPGGPPPSLGRSRASSEDIPTIYSPVVLGGPSRILDTDDSVQGDARNKHAWKPPTEWGCPPASYTLMGPGSPTTQKSMGSSSSKSDNPDLMSLDLVGLQWEIKRMATATPRDVLLRLREDWGSSPDGRLYKELESEKKRWMLAALYNMEPIRSIHARAPQKIEPDENILALFETETSASYLAAVHNRATIHHMSPNPLSHEMFPNVRPMIFPTMPRTIPLPPNFISTAYSHYLPAVVTAAQIPVLLQSIHRCLRMRGKLRITLVDPAPVRATTGPRMQAWLEDNLLLNLQRKFRCANPVQLFPAWLRDAGLHVEEEGPGPASSRTVRFPAVRDVTGGAGGGLGAAMSTMSLGTSTNTGGGGGTSRLGSRGNNGGNARPEENTRAELHAELGRMLWREVWGPYVTAGKWWWEIPECRAECLRFGTQWEYAMLVAVKKTPYTLDP